MSVFFPFGIPVTSSYAETASYAFITRENIVSASFTNFANFGPSGSIGDPAQPIDCSIYGATFQNFPNPAPGAIIPTNVLLARENYILCVLPATPTPTPTTAPTPTPTATPIPTPTTTPEPTPEPTATPAPTPTPSATTPPPTTTPEATPEPTATPAPTPTPSATTPPPTPSATTPPPTPTPSATTPPPTPTPSATTPPPTPSATTPPPTPTATLVCDFVGQFDQRSFPEVGELTDAFCGITAGDPTISLSTDETSFYQHGGTNPTCETFANGIFLTPNQIVTEFLSCVDGDCSEITCPEPPPPSVGEFEIAFDATIQGACDNEPITLYSDSLDFAPGIKLYENANLTNEVSIGIYLNYQGSVYQYISTNGGQVGEQEGSCSAPDPTPAPTATPEPTQIPVGDCIFQYNVASGGIGSNPCDSSREITDGVYLREEPLDSGNFYAYTGPSNSGGNCLSNLTAGDYAVLVGGSVTGHVTATSVEVDVGTRTTISSITQCPPPGNGGGGGNGGEEPEEQEE
jgi:hypothetical protein